MKIIPKFRHNQLILFFFILALFLPLFFSLFPSTTAASVTSSTPVTNFPQTNGGVYAMTLSEEGNILYIGGNFTQVTDAEGTCDRNHLAAIDLQTLMVTSWDPGANGVVYALEVSGSDIYVGGVFTEVGGESRINLAKLNNTTGEADSSWNPSTNNTVYTLAVSGSDIYVGGAFTVAGGESRSQFAKLNNTDGKADLNCNPNFWTDPAEEGDTVHTIKIDTDYIYLGGSFDKVGGSGGTVRNELARLNKDSSCSLDSWNPDLGTSSNKQVQTLDVSGSDIYVGGTFTEVGGESRINLAKLNNTTGEADSSWEVDTNWPGDVATIKIDGADLYVGGNFFTVGGESRDYLALLETTTGTVNSWDPHPSSFVDTTSIAGDYLVVGGKFIGIGGSERLYLAAFPHEAPVTPTPTPTPSTSSSSSSSSSETSFIQIPGMSSLVFNGIVATPIIDSDPGGQEVLTIIQPQTFGFDGFLSANQVNPSTLVPGPISSVNSSSGSLPSSPSLTSSLNNFSAVAAGGGEGMILGVKSPGFVSWQVGKIQEIWYKGYPAFGYQAAKIIPELQVKSSIIALNYQDRELIPPGKPKTKFSELKLKLAHSLDGKTWTILKSVVDPVNNTVATLGKVGGYYMIVGRY